MISSPGREPQVDARRLVCGSACGLADAVTGRQKQVLTRAENPCTSTAARPRRSTATISPTHGYSFSESGVPYLTALAEPATTRVVASTHATSNRSRFIRSPLSCSDGAANIRRPGGLARNFPWANARIQTPTALRSVRRVQTNVSRLNTEVARSQAEVPLRPCGRPSKRRSGDAVSPKPRARTGARTPRAFPAAVAHLTHGAMRVSAWLRGSGWALLGSNQ